MIFSFEKVYRFHQYTTLKVIFDGFGSWSNMVLSRIMVWAFARKSPRKSGLKPWSSFFHGKKTNAHIAKYLANPPI
jgi:hypothetical protein